MTVTAGIVGFGFVGRAIVHGLSGKIDFMINDPKIEQSASMDELVKKCNPIFIAVPTPMRLETNKIDTSIMDYVIEKICSLQEGLKEKPIIVIKSTITPDALRRYKEEHPDLRLVMNPEFLTERNAKLDFLNQSRIVLGGDREDTEPLDTFYSRFGFAHVPKWHMPLEAAALVKYMCNTFLATKLSFMNEWHQLIKKANLEFCWENMLNAFLGDNRIGNSHVRIPGPDGKPGWGGKCFPKDLNALVHYAEDSLSIDMKTLKAAWESNLKVRPIKDWEEIEGATSNG